MSAPAVGGANRTALLVAAVAINLGLFLVMEQMVSRERVRLVDGVRAETIEFLNQPLQKQTKTKDRRRKPPPKPQQMKKTVARMEHKAMEVADLPLPQLNVASLLDSGGVGIGLGERLERGGGAAGEPETVAFTDLTPLSLLPPRYPPAALNRGTEGFVEVRFVVNELGAVDTMEVVASRPKGVFEDAALAAVKRWRFRPYERDGVALVVAARYKINFTIDDEAGQR